MPAVLDWQAMPEGREKYAAYLCSREWGLLKEAVHTRAEGVCERCKRNPIDAVHHQTYERKYREELADLLGLCKGCHDFTHGKSVVDPAEGARTIVLDGVFPGQIIRCSRCDAKGRTAEEATQIKVTATRSLNTSAGSSLTLYLHCCHGHRQTVTFSTLDGKTIIWHQLEDE